MFLYLYRHSNLGCPEAKVAAASEKQNGQLTTNYNGELVIGKAIVIMFGFCMLIVHGPSSTKV